jgi:hypothetical protein
VASPLWIAGAPPRRTTGDLATRGGGASVGASADGASVRTGVVGLALVAGARAAFSCAGSTAFREGAGLGCGAARFGVFFAAGLFAARGAAEECAEGPAAAESGGVRWPEDAWVTSTVDGVRVGAGAASGFRPGADRHAEASNAPPMTRSR